MLHSCRYGTHTASLSLEIMIDNDVGQPSHLQLKWTILAIPCPWKRRPAMGHKRRMPVQAVPLMDAITTPLEEGSVESMAESK